MLGHKCKGLQLLIGDCRNNIIEEQVDMDLQEQKISLNALIGLLMVKTMQVRVKVGSHEFITLIDSGSMHNFINESMVEL